MLQVHAQSELLGTTARTEDEVVYRATIDQDVGVVGCEPMQIIDRPLAREHVVVLALHSQDAPIYAHPLR